jgi:glycosyltransferase involved in cell wall biosynthesis
MSHVGIDYTPAYEQGAGIGRYVRELVKALAAVDKTTAYHLFAAGAVSVDELPDPPGRNFTWKPTRISPRWLARIWHRARIPYPVERFVGDVTVFHATDFVLPPHRAQTRTLLTVHDLSFVLVPETASPRLKQYLDRVVPRSVALADHILADSRATKNDLVNLYGTSPEKITVLLSGVDPRFRPITDQARVNAVRQKYNLGTWPFLFTIGTVQPRKNYGRICEALHELSTEHPDLHLVIAGGKGWLDDPIYATVNRLGLSDRVHFIGFADDEDLPALYSTAATVPYVSLYEGFGLPVLEAMACGTPVVASNVSSIPEVAGDAALLVPPADTHAIADALHKILASPDMQQELISSGLQQASQFTWQRAAQQLKHIYQQLLTP